MTTTVSGYLKPIAGLAATVFFLTVSAGSVGAGPYDKYYDPFKKQVCGLAMNLGLVASREFFFGRAFSTGEPPPDQVTAIAANVGNAIAFTGEAESLIGDLQPQGRSQSIHQFTTILSGYMGKRGSMNYKQRESTIANLASRYRQSLEWTYNSSRPDSFQYRSNCASHLFHACYEFGYAATAAAVGDGSNQNGRVGAMRAAIRSGMSLAYDRERQSNAKQVCCNMGSEADWAPILAMTGNSPHSLFVANTPIMPAIAASIPPAQCTAGQYKCGGVLGSWAWPKGTATFSGGPTGGHASAVGSPHVSQGTWSCVGPETVRITWNNGKFVDTMTRSGNVLSGSNQNGFRFKSARVAQPGSTGGETRHAGCGGVLGSWAWPKGTAIFSGGPTGGRASAVGNPHVSQGTWSCVGPETVRITWNNGKFIDTMTRTGNVLSGSNQTGFRFSSSRVSQSTPSGGETCEWRAGDMIYPAACICTDAQGVTTTAHRARCGK